MAMRIVSAAVAAPLVIFLVYIGGWPYAVAALIVSLMALNEFYQLAVKKGTIPDRAIVFFGGLLLGIVGASGREDYLGAVLALLILGALSIQLIRRKAVGALSSPSISLFGAIYVGWPVAVILLLRGPFGGIDRAWLSILLFLTVWGNDIGAYLWGSIFGAKKLCPRISPRKTREGAFGGFLTGVAIAFGANYVGNRTGIGVVIDAYRLLGFAAFVGVAGQIGDLCESALKRDAGVKDSGIFLPGHGGVLDRVDSLLFAGLVAYYYIKMFLPGML